MDYASDVYFTDMKTRSEGSLLSKLKKLVCEAGIDKIDMNKKFVAIKIHFGEPGNLSYLRANYAKVIADIVKEKGGIPFLTDCSTLYVGRRKDAVEHIEAAYENGFNPFATGCHVIIGDGLKGDDDIEVPIDSVCLKNAKIGRVIVDADIIISMTHFKCHELMGIGGAIKNLGMGCASRRGKMELHSSNKPSVDADECKGCGHCVSKCAHSAITLKKKKAEINDKLCAGCGHCISACRFDAINVRMNQSIDLLCRRTAEYALASVIGKPNFHVSLVIDVSPMCDCYGKNDVPIVPDVGMFASFDPVALDVACADSVNSQPVVKESLLHGKMKKDSDDKFSCTHPVTDWNITVEHSEKIGLGVRKYKIKKVE
ncbi:MAG: DUF362 domain-containing protein [Methanomassiliicoccaceae archaeon]|jgi:uncharacterized Fe-S center protein|nr:DUF362 domain-containing protein [Methanomassiliicoccaceae archaeon]